MPTFRPSARVRLALRLEEGAVQAALRSRLDRGDEPETPETITLAPIIIGGSARARAEIEQQLEANQRAREAIAQARDELNRDLQDFLFSDLDRTRDRLQSQLAAPTLDAPPDAIGGAGPDDEQVLGSILPISFTIERNGIRTADTAQVVLDYRDAPFDPRLIRAASIQCVLGVVDAESYEAGVAGAVRDDGTTLSTVPRGTSAQGQSPPGTTRFLGLIDEWGVTLDSMDGDKIELECRDLTAILADTQLPPGAGINLDVPIDRGVRELLDSIAATRGTTVVFGVAGEESDAPIPGDAVARARRSRRGGTARRLRQGGRNLSLWDHITEICVQVGLVPVFEDTRLRILRPRTFYEGRDTPRRMILGRNLSSLSFSRKLGGALVPTIEVRSYDSAIGRTRWARYPVRSRGRASGVFGVTNPPRPTRASRTGPSGQNPSDEIRTFTLAGIVDPATLERSAEAIWHQIGRQNIEGKIKTSDAWSWERPIEQADLIQMRPGDALELLVASPETEEISRGTTLTSASQLRALQRDARAAYLESLGWSPDVAQRFAALQDATAFQTVFRVQNVRLVWDQGEGLTVECDFTNFLEVRELGDEPALTATPSPQIAQLTEGRNDTTSTDLRNTSAERNNLLSSRERGLVTDDQFSQQVTDLLRRERQLRRDTES